ncbi:MAG: hypothetical protein ABIE03_06430 [Patescibacteria group bacterium]|nr:hypothetical protein [Patescibacteria group bacterium]
MEQDSGRVTTEQLFNNPLTAQRLVGLLASMRPEVQRISIVNQETGQREEFNLKLSNLDLNKRLGEVITEGGRPFVVNIEDQEFILTYFHLNQDIAQFLIDHLKYPGSREATFRIITFAYPPIATALRENCTLEALRAKFPACDKPEILLQRIKSLIVHLESPFILDTIVEADGGNHAARNLDERIMIAAASPEVDLHSFLTYTKLSGNSLQSTLISFLTVRALLPENRAILNLNKQADHLQLLLGKSYTERVPAEKIFIARQFDKFVGKLLGIILTEGAEATV